MHPVLDNVNRQQVYVTQLQEINVLKEQLLVEVQVVNMPVSQDHVHKAQQGHMIVFQLVKLPAHLPHQNILATQGLVQKMLLDNMIIFQLVNLLVPQQNTTVIQENAQKVQQEVMIV